MAKRYQITYTVRGVDPFPMDMLRYDRSFPTGNKSLPHVFRRIEDVHPGEYTVELATVRAYKGDLPTVGRWNRFGWHIDLDSVQVQGLD